jgi:hypothetical protein
MTTATATHIFSLLPDQRRAAYAEALERADEARCAATAEYKARKAAAPDPHRDHYLTWKMQGMVCVLVVKHRDAPNSFAVTRDGSSYPNVFLPFKRTQLLPESGGEFLLALFPRSFVTWMETKDAGKDYAAAQRYRELFGVTFPLSAARPWTDAQIATWKRLDKLRDSINYRIQAARAPQLKRRELTLTRNGAA